MIGIIQYMWLIVSLIAVVTSYGYIRWQTSKIDRRQAELLSHMSHEIRTPLNGILGVTELLEQTGLDASQAEFVNTINKSSHNLLNIVNHILDLAKLGSGKLTLESFNFNLRECVSEITDLLTPQAKNKNLDFSVYIDNQIPNELCGDPLRFKQILTNLLGNAIKFTEQGYVKLNIELTHPGATSYEIRLRIEDTGIGITKEGQRHIFKAFEQADATIGRQFGGTGLGLLITEQLLRKMQGRIEIRSEPDMGSRFDAYMKFKKAAIVDASIPEPVDLLLAEDNPVNRLLFKHLLGKIPGTVTMVDNGKKAVAQAEEKAYDLAIFDIQMPEMDGITAAMAMRATEHNARTPCIMISANVSDTEIERMRAANLKHWLQKPITEASLFVLINQLTGQKNLINIAETVNLFRGNQEHAQEYIAAFLEELGHAKIKIKQHYQQQNWSALGDEIHKLHGACAYCAAGDLKQICYDFEMALSKHQDTEYSGLYQRLLNLI